MKTFDRFEAFAMLYRPDPAHQVLVLNCKAGRAREVELSYRTDTERLVTVRAAISLQKLAPVGMEADTEESGVTLWRIPSSLTAGELEGAHAVVTGVLTCGTVLQRNVPLGMGKTVQQPNLQVAAGTGKLHLRCLPGRTGLELHMTLHLTSRPDPAIYDTRIVLRRQSQVVAVRRLAEMMPLALNAVTHIVRLRDQEMRHRVTQGVAPEVADDEMFSLMEYPDAMLSWLPPTHASALLSALADVARDGGAALQKAGLMHPTGTKRSLVLWQAAVPALTLARLDVEELAAAGLIPMNMGAHPLTPLILQEADSLQIDAHTSLYSCQITDAMNTVMPWCGLSEGLTLIARSGELVPESTTAPETAPAPRPPHEAPQTGDPDLIAAVLAVGPTDLSQPTDKAKKSESQDIAERATVEPWPARWIVTVDNKPTQILPDISANAAEIAPGTRSHAILASVLENTNSVDRLASIVDSDLASQLRPLRRLTEAQPETTSPGDTVKLIPESIIAAIVVLAGKQLPTLAAALQRADKTAVRAILSEILTANLEGLLL